MQVALCTAVLHRSVELQKMLAPPVIRLAICTDLGCPVHITAMQDLQYRHDACGIDMTSLYIKYVRF